MPKKILKPIQAVLFDLDGTLLDTAADIGYALNRLRQEYGFPALSTREIRSLVGFGSRLILKSLIEIDENHPDFLLARQRFYQLYEEQIATHTVFFPNMDKVIAHLDEKKMPWGIVTNKLTNHATQLLTALNLAHRPACLVCGDTLATAKPNPEPILHGCKLLNRPPTQCLYVGDSASDVIASKAAGTASLVALYGYIDPKENPHRWQADGYINDPLEILDYL